METNAERESNVALRFEYEYVKPLARWPEDDPRRVAKELYVRHILEYLGAANEPNPEILDDLRSSTYYSIKLEGSPIVKLRR
jgi:hypothetical protein